MSPNNDRPSFELSAPGKIFLLGEYAILAGMPAIVAAIGPRFSASFTTGPESAELPFHVASPTGRLAQWASRQGIRLPQIRFKDAHGGAGGFGGSTAEFALFYAALARQEGWPRDWQKVWSLYRELTAAESVVPPSGADLVAQWQGGVVFFEPASLRCEDLMAVDPQVAATEPVWPNLLVFSSAAQAGRKVRTHEHLQALLARGFPRAFEPLLTRLHDLVLRGAFAIRENDLENLGRAFSEYAEALSSAELEIEATRDDRRALAAMPGVLGVKGAGALQADSLLVLLDPSAASRDGILATARARGLSLVADGLQRQEGVS